jgi:hypothetical protein
MADQASTVKTWDGTRWIPVPAASVKEHTHGKPEDCPRCNAILHHELCRIGTKGKQ